MKKYHFPILIDQDKDSIYIVTCLTFKVCHSCRKTIDEVIHNIRDVIEICTEDV